MYNQEIPQEIKDTLNRYLQGIPTGSFLEAVLSNDLVMAVTKADAYNIQLLRPIVTYVYNELPSICWGSKDAVENWLKEGHIKYKDVLNLKV